MGRGAGRAGWAKACALSVALLLCGAWPDRAAAYAVLAHEAIIDSAWETDIQPLLLKRFPNATPEQLNEAHGYAYGGAIIQDIGYYPHGNHLFSDLTHYVRSGDFVLALLRDANDIDEYAFALGALSHYAADSEGHKLAVNRAEPVLYPHLQHKYGDWITYEQDPLAHIKTEFGFDVLQVAQGRYGTDAYHNFIGFGVSVRLLEQAFEETYGLNLKEVLEDENKVIGSYRRDVSHVIPKATRVAWSLKKDEIQKDQPSMTRKRFLYHLSRASYEKEWGKDYQQLSFGDQFDAFLIKTIPKIGPLKVLQLKMPTPETEKMFEASFNVTMDQYRRLLKQERDELRPELPNENFDTGGYTGPGQYRLNDDTRARLLDALAKQNFVSASPELRADILSFYSHPDAHYATERKPNEWVKVQAELAQLNGINQPVLGGNADPRRP
jgi:hypothetical protein